MHSESQSWKESALGTSIYKLLWIAQRNGTGANTSTMLPENETPNPPLFSQLLITIQCGMSIANPFRVQSLHFREFQAINAMLMGAVMERAYDQPSDMTHGDGTSPQSHAPVVPKRTHVLPRPKHKLHVGQRVRIANILD